MSIIPFYYSTHHRNFGDALNPLLFERVLGIRIKPENFKNAEMTGVGSLLQKCTVSKYAIHSQINFFFKPQLRVMSSGFIQAPPENHILARKLDVKALRGHESRRIIEKLTGSACDAAVGDGGMLYPLLLDKIPSKQYSVGIIPHYRDRELSSIKELSASLKNATVIDVLDEPLEVLKKIASCSCILSSSLHGLIVSDAMGIPNRHVLFSSNITGNGFKFRDYYSVFTPEHTLPSLQTGEILSVRFDRLFENYLPRQQQIAELQKKLLDAMKITG